MPQRLCLAIFCLAFVAPGRARAAPTWQPVETIHHHPPARTPRQPALPPAVRKLGRSVFRHLPRWLRHTLLRRKADLIVLSDLHLGEGRRGGRYSALEDCTVDRELVQLIHHVLRRQRRSARPLKLVLAGDALDFIKTTRPAPRRRIPDSVDRDARPTEAVALEKLRSIAAGHPRVFAAFRRLLAHGHEITVVFGNHDQELNFPAVQRAFRQLLAADKGRTRRRLHFRPWFELHGRVYIEHGQRYEPLTSIPAMLHPIEDEGGERRLRGSAANFLVAEMLNHIKRDIPQLNFLPSGRRMLLEVARRAPHESTALVQFADRIARRMGEQPPPSVITAHQARLAEMADSRPLLRAVNASRRGMGLPRLSSGRLESLLWRLDRLGARPHLQRPKPRGGRLRRLTTMLKPSELDRWLQPANEATLREGQAFLLTHLSDTVVMGHTHSANHYEIPRPGRTPAHLLNTGTWTPVVRSGHALDRKATLTFADIHQASGRLVVRLRRWDAGRRRAETIPAQPLDAGRFLGEDAPH